MKNNTKSVKSPAPAKNITVEKVVPAAKVAVAPKPAGKVAPKGSKPPVKKAPAKRAPAPKVEPVAPTAVLTTITAKIDIGFGNALYLRGEGAGLSWDRGTQMNCVNDDTWMLELGESVRPVIYKFLVNDLTWSAGEDYVVPAGTSVTVVPAF
jgi:hypothetical protein